MAARMKSFVRLVPVWRNDGMADTTKIFADRAVLTGYLDDYGDADWRRKIRIAKVRVSEVVTPKKRRKS